MISVSKKDINWYGIIFFLTVTILLLYSLYTRGYRLLPGFSVKQASNVVLSTNIQNISLMLDGKLIVDAIHDSTGKIYLGNIYPGKHNIIVNKSGYSSWIKTFNLPPETTLTFDSFIIPKMLGDLTGKINYLKIGTKEYSYALEQFNYYQKPTPTEPVRSPNGTLDAWVEDRKVFIRWVDKPSLMPPYLCNPLKCEKIAQVYKSKNPISSISFWDDATLAVSTGEYLLIIEIDRRGGQNVERLHSDTSISHMTDRSSGKLVLFIKDSSSIMSVEFPNE